MKKLLAICLALTLVLGLAACGGPKTPEEVMAATTENMLNLDSASIYMDMNVTLGAMGMEIPMKIHGDGDVFLKEQKGKLNMTLDMAIAAMDMEVYTEHSGDDQITYMGMDVGSGMEWAKTTIPAGSYAPTASLASLQNIANLTQAEESEMVGGVEATRYDGMISGNTIPKLLAPMMSMGGMNEVMGELGGMEEILEKLDPNAEILLTCYVDRESMTLLQMDVDLTDILGALMNETLAETGMSVTSYTLSLGYTNFNNANPVEIPEEARTAPEL